MLTAEDIALASAILAFVASEIIPRLPVEGNSLSEVLLRCLGRATRRAQPPQLGARPVTFSAAPACTAGAAAACSFADGAIGLAPPETDCGRSLGMGVRPRASCVCRPSTARSTSAARDMLPVSAGGAPHVKTCAPVQTGAYVAQR